MSFFPSRIGPIIFHNMRCKVHCSFVRRCQNSKWLFVVGFLYNFLLRLGCQGPKYLFCKIAKTDKKSRGTHDAIFAATFGIFFYLGVVFGLIVIYNSTIVCHCTPTKKWNKKVQTVAILLHF